MNIRTKSPQKLYNGSSFYSKVLSFFPIEKFVTLKSWKQYYFWKLNILHTLMSPKFTLFHIVFENVCVIFMPERLEKKPYNVISATSVWG